MKQKIILISVFSGQAPLSSTSRLKEYSEDTHPDKVHFLAVLHEGPDLGAELFPHAFQIMEHSQLLERLVHLELGKRQSPQEKEKRQRQWSSDQLSFSLESTSPLHHRSPHEVTKVPRNAVAEFQTSRPRHVALNRQCWSGLDLRV